MNAEPLVDQRFEANEVKRLGVFRISNHMLGHIVEQNKNRYLNYYISDPTINLSMHETKSNY